MILQIDAGNTRIKWRIIDAGTTIADGHQLTRSFIDGEALRLPIISSLKKAQLCNVAGESVAALLVAQLAAQYNLDLQLAQVSQQVGSVICGYEHPEKLGVDRWMAILAASDGRQAPLIIVDAGSAVTIDMVDDRGRHRGGYIVPGITLMHAALWKGTDRVKVDQQHSDSLSIPGINTEQAVGKGCSFMLVALIERLLASYSADLVITGGDGERLNSQLARPGDYIPDLVLDGLSVEQVCFVSGGSQ